MEDKLIKNKIKRLVSLINPHDSLEKEHIDDVCDWISSSSNIFRIKKDATPPKHLVSYSLVIDHLQEKVLLFDHKKAKLMLPSGGHIEVDEMPLTAAKRELKEELELALKVYSPNNREEVPFFVTATQTVGVSEPHVDVSLWYLFVMEKSKSFKLNSDEFDDFHWLSFDEVLSTSIKKLDPHMHRLIHKIRENKIF